MLQKKIFTIFLFVQLCLTSCEQYDSVRLNRINKTVDANSLFSKGTYVGKGSFGEVRFVNYGGIEIAIKRIKLAKSGDSKKFRRKLDMALHEIRILKNLSTATDGDNYFPYFYGCGFQGDQTYGPMNVYVIQEVLYKDLKKNNALNLINNVVPKDRIKLYLELAKGLQFMHHMNYVHSDLKPENMMTNQSVSKGFNGLHFKIIDFGMTDTTNNYVMGGSPVFNSPEKINGDSKNRFSHDIWAYGLTVAAIESKSAYLFSGLANSCFQSSFTNICGSRLLKNVSNVVDNVFGGNSKFSNIIKKTVTFDLSKRTRSMGDVVRAIEKIIKDDEEELNILEMTTTVNKKKLFKLEGTELEKEKERERINQITNRVKHIRNVEGKIERNVVRHAPVVRKKPRVVQREQREPKALKPKKVYGVRNVGKIEKQNNTPIQKYEPGYFAKHVLNKEQKEEPKSTDYQNMDFKNHYVNAPKVQPKKKKGTYHFKANDFHDRDIKGRDLPDYREQKKDSFGIGDRMRKVVNDVKTINKVNKQFNNLREKPKFINEERKKFTDDYVIHDNRVQRKSQVMMNEDKIIDRDINQRYKRII